MTDPQDDVPCRGCEAEGPPARLDDEGMCRDCRAPHDPTDLMADLLLAMADAIEAGGGNDAITERLIDALPGLSWSDCSIALRRLVGAS